MVPGGYLVTLVGEYYLSSHPAWVSVSPRFHPVQKNKDLFDRLCRSMGLFRVAGSFLNKVARKFTAKSSKERIYYHICTARRSVGAKTFTARQSVGAKTFTARRSVGAKTASYRKRTCTLSDPLRPITTKQKRISRLAFGWKALKAVSG